VLAARFAGSKLVFLDIEEEGGVAQIVINRGNLGEDDEALASKWADFRHVVRRGDWYSK